jgi:hypothetical protein
MKILLQTDKLAICWWKASDWHVDKGKWWFALNLGRLQLIFYKLND